MTKVLGTIVTITEIIKGVMTIINDLVKLILMALNVMLIILSMVWFITIYSHWKVSIIIY